MQRHSLSSRIVCCSLLEGVFITPRSAPSPPPVRRLSVSPSWRSRSDRDGLPGIWLQSVTNLHVLFIEGCIIGLSSVFQAS